MADKNKYKRIVKLLLSDKRYDHSLAVSKEAVRLAEKYGENTEKAEVAGLLHDIMKEAEPEMQLNIITDLGIVLNDIELNAKKLWHQISGMAYAKVILKIDDQDILNAIRYHTSGRADMSLLEKIVFVADFTSKDRNYNGVDEMRKNADKSLELAMAEGLSFVIMELSEEKKPIVADTFSAYNQAVINR